MVRVEGHVVEVEEAEPVSLRDGGVAADGVVLVRHPHDQDDVERRVRVLEELGHDGLHAWKRTRRQCNGPLDLRATGQ